MSAPPTATGGGSPWLRRFGIFLAAIFLTLLFVVLGFPYDKLGERISSEARNAGMPLEIVGLSPSLGLAGPGFAAERVAIGEGREAVELADVTLRHAWSLSWLSGSPALFVDLASDLGAATGTLTLGGDTGFTGQLREVRLEKLPLSEDMKRFSARGLLNADSDLLLVQEPGAPAPVPNGTLQFTIADGSVSAPNLPFGLPFEKITGDLVFGAESFADIQRLELEGPMLGAKITGRILQSERGWDGPIDMEIEVHAPDPMTRRMLQNQVSLDAQGRGKLKVKGSLSNPVVRGGARSAQQLDPFG